LRDRAGNGIINQNMTMVLRRKIGTEVRREDLSDLGPT